MESLHILPEGAMSAINAREWSFPPVHLTVRALRRKKVTLICMVCLSAKSFVMSAKMTVNQGENYVIHVYIPYIEVIYHRAMDLCDILRTIYRI